MKIHKHTETMVRNFVKDGNVDAAVRVWSGAYRASMSSRSDKYLLSLFADAFGISYEDSNLSPR